MRWTYFFTVPTLQRMRSAIPIGQPGGEQGQGLELDAGERVAGGGLGGRGVRERAEQGRVEDRAAVAYHAHRGQQLAAPDALEHVTGRAGLDRASDHRGIVVHADHEDRGARRSGLDAVQRLDAVHVRQLDIEQDQLGVKCGRALHRLGAAAGLGDDLDVVAAQHAGEPGPHHRVIVDDQHAERQLGSVFEGRHGFAGAPRGSGGVGGPVARPPMSVNHRGSRARTSVPPVGSA